MFTWYIQTAQTVKMDKANRTYGIPLRNTLTWVITSAMPCAKVHERVLFVARVAIAGKQGEEFALSATRALYIVSCVEADTHVARNRRVSNMHASNLKNLTSNVAPPACLDLKSRFVFTFSGIFFSLPTRLVSFVWKRFAYT